MTFLYANAIVTYISWWIFGIRGKSMIRIKVLILAAMFGPLPAGCVSQPMLSPESVTETDQTMAAPKGSQPSRSAIVLLDRKFETAAPLADVLEYAALNNPELRSAFEKWKASLAAANQSGYLPDPRFTYQYYIRNVETRTGPQRHSYAIAQTFPWFGKLDLASAVASEQARADEKRFQAAKLKLFYLVKDAYCEYYYLAKAITATEQNVELLKQMESVARTRYKAAAAKHFDVIRIQVELGKLTDRLSSLRDLRRPVVARLNAVMNRRVDAELAWPEPIGDERIDATDQQLIDWLEEHNPELQAMDREIAARRAGVDLAKRGYFPDVTLGVTYIDTGNSIGGRHPSDDGRDPILAMVSVNVPIWWNKLDAGVSEAKHRRQWAVYRRNHKVNALGSQLSVATFNLRDAERKTALYRDMLLPKAHQASKASQASYRAGGGTFQDMLDAQQILLEFELAHQRALADRAKRIAEIEMIVGRDIPRAGSAPAAADVDSNDSKEE